MFNWLFGRTFDPLRYIQPLSRGWIIQAPRHYDNWWSCSC